MRRTFRFTVLVAALLSLAPLLTGCWDRQELERMAFVTALGIDDAQGEVKVTALIAVPAALAGAGGGGGRSGGAVGPGTPALIATVTTGTVAEAVSAFDRMLGRRASFLQTQIVIFGQGAARQGIADDLEYVTRFWEFRRTILVAVAETEAEEYFRLQPGLEKDPVKFTVDLIEGANRTGGAPVNRVNRFLVEAESFGAEPVVPLLRLKMETPREHVHAMGEEPFAGAGPARSGKSGGAAKKAGGETTAKGEEDKVSPGEMAGAAVFRGDRMVERLDGSEAFYYMVAAGRLAQMDRVFPLPEKGKRATVRLSNSSAAVRAGWRDGGPHIALTISLAGDVLETGGRRSPTDPQTKAALEKTIKRDLTLGIQKVVRKTQAKQTDIFQWGERYRPQFATWSEFRRFNWRERYPRANVDVSVNVNIPRTGTTLEPAPIHQ